MTKELTEASEAYAKSNTQFDDEFSCDVRAFIAGALWSEKHSPRVLALVEALEKLTTKMNPVTAAHRHGSPIDENDLDEMSNAQIDAEAVLAAWRGE